MRKAEGLRHMKHAEGRMRKAEGGRRHMMHAEGVPETVELSVQSA